MVDRWISGRACQFNHLAGIWKCLVASFGIVSLACHPRQGMTLQLAAVDIPRSRIHLLLIFLGKIATYVSLYLELNQWVLGLRFLRHLAEDDDGAKNIAVQ